MSLVIFRVLHVKAIYMCQYAKDSAVIEARWSHSVHKLTQNPFPAYKLKSVSCNLKVKVLGARVALEAVFDMSSGIGGGFRDGDAECRQATEVWGEYLTSPHLCIFMLKGRFQFSWGQENMKSEDS